MPQGLKSKPKTPEERYGPALEKAIQALPNLVPDQAAAHADVTFQQDDDGTGHFEVPFFGSIYHVAWPSGTVHNPTSKVPVDIGTKILLLHYLLTADGTALACEWTAFRSLPGGMGYDAAFQGRSSLRLVGPFGDNLAGFKAAATALGGERLAFGDASFLFRVLPRMWVAVILYLADEEFPASVNVLFDKTASHYLPTEDLAVVGGILAGRLKKAAVA